MDHALFVGAQLKRDVGARPELHVPPASVWYHPHAVARTRGGMCASNVLVLDLHEIVAGKLAALVDRNAARDLFDARRILSIEGLDWKKIRAAFLALGACLRRDWRTVSIGAIKGDPQELRQKLVISLPRGHFGGEGEIDTWIEETVTLCRERLAFLFDLTEAERGIPRWRLGSRRG